MNLRRLLLVAAVVAVAVLVPTTMAGAAKQRDGVDVDKAEATCRKAGGVVMDHDEGSGGGFTCWLPDGRVLDCTAAGSCILWDAGECGVAPTACVPDPASGASDGTDGDGDDSDEAVDPHAITRHPAVGDEREALDPSTPRPLDDAPSTREAEPEDGEPDPDADDGKSDGDNESPDDAGPDPDADDGKSGGDDGAEPDVGQHMRPRVPDQRKLAPTGPSTTTVRPDAASGSLTARGQLAR